MYFIAGEVMIPKDAIDIYELSIQDIMERHKVSRMEAKRILNDKLKHGLTDTDIKETIGLIRRLRRWWSKQR